MTRTMAAVLAVMSFQMFSRGMDYALGNPQPGTGIFQVTDSTPPLVWGVACVSTSVVAAVAIMLRRIVLLRNASVLAVAIYLGFAVVIFDDVYGADFSQVVLFCAFCVVSALTGGVAYLLLGAARAPAWPQLGLSLITALAAFIAQHMLFHPLVDDWRFFTSYLSSGAIWAICAWALTIRAVVLRSREGRTDECG